MLGRLMSDLGHTVSCERLPQSTAARMERSRFTSSYDPFEARGVFGMHPTSAIIALF